MQLSAKIILLSLFFLSPHWAWAAEEKKAETKADSTAGKAEAKEKKEEEEEDKGPSFEKLVKKSTKIPGLFTFYRDEEENKVLMEIKPEQIDRIYLCSVTLEEAEGRFFHASSMMYRFPFAFERVGKKIFLVHKNVYVRADPDAAIHRAVDGGLSDSIVGTAGVEGQPHPERGSILVNPEGFFIQDIGQVGYIFGEFIKDFKYSFDKGNSYFGQLKAFPENSEVEVALHFTSPGNKYDSGVSWLGATIPDNRSFQHVYHYSLSALPQGTFKPRLADDRVGHFLTMHQDYSTVLRETLYKRYVNRWNLEKAEPKFKQSPPQKPIVFWLENTIPVEYREAVKEGILLWNLAFERLGFKDAIVVKQQPDDAEWDPADARYSTVRWLVAPGAGYARGPSHTNPLTGEIYDADIVVSADMIRYVFLGYDEFTNPVALGAEAEALGRWRNYGQGFCDMWAGATREASFGWELLSARAEAVGGAVDAEDYLRQFLVSVMAHEVGHTLGLRHNFKASTIHPLDQLNDVRLTAKEGITSSVMDYIPVNIAPGDTEQGAYFQTSLGPYDYWAIEYAYKSIDADDAESERKKLDKIAGRVADPKIPYGTDEDALGWTTGIDPSCNRWDLGTDPIAFYRGRLALSKELWSRVESKFEKEGTRYQKLSRVFGRGFGAFYGAGETVTKYIGGIYNYRDHVGDGRMPLVPVPAEKQREALQFLTEHIFSPQAFEFDPELLNKLAPERWLDFGASAFNVRRIDHPIHDKVLNIQQGPLNRLYDPVLLGRLLDMELRFAPGKAFTMAELFVGLRQSIWAELDSGSGIGSFRRNLQRAHLQKLIDLVVRPADGVPEDACTLARADLKAIGAGIDKVLGQDGLDTYVGAHLDETQARIKAALEAGIDRQI